VETEQELYFDPFADDGAELFDPNELFEQIKSNYEQGNIEHDYSADNFVKDTEALLLDATFVERFDAVQAIAAEMHRMCGEDHVLRTAMSESGYFGSEDAHGHEGHKHDHDTDKDSKKKKKDKKKAEHSKGAVQNSKKIGIWALLFSSKK
jgi:hypothetical protein